MEEYLEVWDHITESKKKGWRIADLGKNIEREFRIGDQVVRLALTDRSTGITLVVLYHTPVTRNLRRRGERLGNYMHSMKKFRPPNDEWWNTFRREITETTNELRTANVGTLLGPPLMKTGTKKVDMRVEVVPGFDHNALMKGMVGESVIMEVRYLAGLPDVMEPEASVWRNAS